MMLALDTALLLVAAFAALLVARLQGQAGLRRFPWLTLSIMLVLAVALAAQILAPELLPRFQREASAIGRGDTYRLFTALWFQDGGLTGGAFNLVMLFFVGSAAERVWTRRAWLLVYFGVGLGAELLALWWQPIGAGNSVAFFGLAGSMLVPRGQATRPWVVGTLQLLGLAAGVALALGHDIHGAALLAGAVFGLILDRLRAFTVRTSAHRR